MITTESSVADRNLINAEANIIEGHLLRMLSPWQGKKIRKVSGHGGNVAKLQAEFDQYCLDHGCNQLNQPYWLNMYASCSSLIATLRQSMAGTLKVEMYLGRWDNTSGILTHLGEGYKRRTDYTLEWVEATRKQAAQLEDQARELRSQLREFN
jgi:hypothetical protein